MLQQFAQYIATRNLFTRHDKILLGVSGGIDSMVMCDLFLKSGYTFAIAHSNFQLRADESDGDEQLVAKYAQQHSIPFYVIRFDTIQYAQSNGISTQMAARDLRYNWFSELMRNNGYTKLAIAHHADDVIETFFINLARGTGLGGLCSMPAKNQNIVRPLLFALRSQITTYAQEQNIAYREDSSNASDKYARNRIRHHIVPQMQHINPSFGQTMLGNMQHLQDVQYFVGSEMAKAAQDICFERDDKFYIDIEKLKQFSSIALFLYYTLQPYGFKNDIITQIEEALDALAGKQFFSHTHILIKDREYLIVSPQLNQDSSSEYILNEIEGEIESPINLHFKRIEKTSDFKINKSLAVAQLDFDKLKFPLMLRKWQHGDSFIPLGMRGCKKLSNFFLDNKYSFFDKQSQWLLVSGGEIVWVVGKRIDERFKVTARTKNVWQVEVL